MEEKKAYVIDLFTEQDPTTATPVILPEAERVSLVRGMEKPPPLDMFYYSEKGLL
jgi:hypothetical protein